jgi:hypothetical protein
MSPKAPPTANCMGPKKGNHCRTVLLAMGVAERVLQEGVKERARDDQEADGTVGRTIRAEGLVGYGVMSRRTSPLSPGVVHDRIHRADRGDKAAQTEILRLPWRPGRRGSLLHRVIIIYA